MKKTLVKFNNDLYEVYYGDSLVIKTNIKMLAEKTQKLIIYFFKNNTDNPLVYLDNVIFVDIITDWINIVLDWLNKMELRGVFFSWELETLFFDNKKNKENPRYDTLSTEISDNEKKFNAFLLTELYEVVDEYCADNIESLSYNQDSNQNLFSIVLSNDIYKIMFEDEALISTNNSSLAYTSKNVLDMITEMFGVYTENKFSILFTAWIEQTYTLLKKANFKGVYFSWLSEMVLSDSLDGVFKYDSRNMIASKDEIAKTNEIINKYCNGAQDIFKKSTIAPQEIIS